MNFILTILVVSSAYFFGFLLGMKSGKKHYFGIMFKYIDEMARDIQLVCTKTQLKKLTSLTKDRLNNHLKEHKKCKI